MFPFRTFLLLAATSLTVSPCVAQRCVGHAITGRNYLGLEQRESWTGAGTHAEVHGLQYAHGVVSSSGLGIIGTVSGAHAQPRGDTSVTHVAASLSVGRALDGVTPNLAACLTLGVEVRAVDHPSTSDGFASLPITLGLGYDVQLGRVLLTPFAAPTMAYYQFESQAVQGGARQAGWDAYVTLGMTVAFDRFSFAANWRRGDLSLGDAGRFAFTTGVSF